MHRQEAQRFYSSQFANFERSRRKGNTLKKCVDGSMGHAATLSELDESKLVFPPSWYSGLRLYPSYPGPIA